MIKHSYRAADLSDEFQPDSLEGAKTSLQEVLLHIVDGRVENDPELDAALRHWGTPPPRGRFVVGDGSIVGPRKALINVWDSADYALPFRALLTFDGGWNIEWFDAECVSCFGTGIADGEACGTCGGGGWGTLNSTTYRYVPSRPGSRQSYPQAANA